MVYIFEKKDFLLAYAKEGLVPKTYSKKEFWSKTYCGAEDKIIHRKCMWAGVNSSMVSTSVREVKEVGEVGTCDVLLCCGTED